MSVILLALGIVVAVAGGAMVGFGFPIRDFSFGNTLIVAGVTALSGGLILVGIAVAVGELRRIGDTLRATQRQPRPAEPSEPKVQPTAARPVAPRAPYPPRAPDRRPGEPRPAGQQVDVSTAAIERMRANIPRSEHNGGEAPAVAEHDMPLPPPAPSRPVAAPGQRTAGNAAAQTELRAERLVAGNGAAPPSAKAAKTLEFPWRRRSKRQQITSAAPQSAPPPAPVSVPPLTTQPRPVAKVAAAPAPVAAPAAASAPAAPAAPAPQVAAPAPAILKSGVVDGMAYTLYEDGSIEAQLPEGLVRFDSIAALRDHIEGAGG